MMCAFMMHIPLIFDPDVCVYDACIVSEGVQNTNIQNTNVQNTASSYQMQVKPNGLFTLFLFPVLKSCNGRR